MRLLVPSLLLAAALVPLAGAAPFVCQGAFIAGACAGQWDLGDCSTTGYEGNGAQGGMILGGAWVEGSRYCWTNGQESYSDQGIFAGSATFLAGAAVSWFDYTYTDASGSTSDCVTALDFYVLFIEDGIDFGCPQGSPADPGWGHVLP